MQVREYRWRKRCDAQVLLADDHTIVAQGLASLLRDDFDLVGTVGDGQALIDAAQQRLARRHRRRHGHAGDGWIGGTAPAQSGTQHRQSHLSDHACRRPTLPQALRAGASGYVLKHSAGEELITAIRKCCKGGPI